jgi:transposase-like protein
MAKKGQIFKNYSKETKEEILNKYFEENVPVSALSKEYEISHNTIFTWISKAKRGIEVLKDTQDSRTGRPKKEEGEIDYKERYEILKKYQAFLKAQRERK